MNKNYLNYALDAVIALAFLLASASGLAFMVMGSGGFQGGRNPGFLTSFLGIPREVWSDLHALVSIVMIAGVLAHVVLHWRWVVCVTRRVFEARLRRSATGSGQSQDKCEIAA